MLSLSQIEQDLVVAMKAKDQLAVETLRGLKTRVQNEKTAASSRPEAQAEGSTQGGKELSENAILALVRSEVKRRKEAAVTYTTGGRQELADKELAEASILEKYLPAQMPEGDLVKIIDDAIAQNSWTVADFGKAMGKLKAQVGDQADGALLAKILKEKLK